MLTHNVVLLFMFLFCCPSAGSTSSCDHDNVGVASLLRQLFQFPVSMIEETSCDVDSNDIDTIITEDATKEPACLYACSSEDYTLLERAICAGLRLAIKIKGAILLVFSVEEWTDILVTSSQFLDDIYENTSPPQDFISSLTENFVNYQNAVWDATTNGLSLVNSALYTVKEEVKSLVAYIEEILVLIYLDISETLGTLYEEMDHSCLVTKYLVPLISGLILLTVIVKYFVQGWQLCSKISKRLSYITQSNRGKIRSGTKLKSIEHYPMCEFFDYEICNCGGISTTKQPNPDARKHYKFCQIYDMLPCNCSVRTKSIKTKANLSNNHTNVSDAAVSKPSPRTKKLIDSESCNYGAIDIKTTQKKEPVVLKKYSPKTKQEENEQTRVCYCFGSQPCLCNGTDDNSLLNTFAYAVAKPRTSSSMEDIITTSKNTPKQSNEKYEPISKKVREYCKVKKQHYQMCEIFNTGICNCRGRKKSSQGPSSAIGEENVENRTPIYKSPFQSEDTEDIVCQELYDDSFNDKLNMTMESAIFGTPRHNSSFKEILSNSPPKPYPPMTEVGCGDGAIYSTVTRRSPFKESGLGDLADDTDISILVDEETSFLDVSDINNSMSLNETQYGILEVAVLFMVQTAWRLAKKVIRTQLADDTRNKYVWVEEKESGLFVVKEKTRPIRYHTAGRSRNNNASGVSEDEFSDQELANAENFENVCFEHRPDDSQQVMSSAESSEFRNGSYFSDSSHISGDRQSVSGDWQSVSGDWQSVSGDWQSVNGDRQSDSGDRQSDSRDRQTDIGDRQSDIGERQSVNRDMQSVSGDQQSDNGDWQSDSEDRKSVNGDRQSDSGDWQSDNLCGTYHIHITRQHLSDSDQLQLLKHLEDDRNNNSRMEEENLSRHKLTRKRRRSLHERKSRIYKASSPQKSVCQKEEIDSSSGESNSPSLKMFIRDSKEKTKAKEPCFLLNAYSAYACPFADPYSRNTSNNRNTSYSYSKSSGSESLRTAADDTDVAVPNDTPKYDTERESVGVGVSLSEISIRSVDNTSEEFADQSASSSEFNFDNLPVEADVENPCINNTSSSSNVHPATTTSENSLDRLDEQWLGFQQGKQNRPLLEEEEVLPRKCKGRSPESIDGTSKAPVIRCDWSCIE